MDGHALLDFRARRMRRADLSRRLMRESSLSVDDLVLPGGRLKEQMDIAYELLTAIPGVSCVRPKGALYLFPRLDPKVFKIKDDRRMVLDLLRSEKIMVVQGTGFNWPDPDHFRVVTLPTAADLRDAMGRIGRFLDGYGQP